MNANATGYMWEERFAWHDTGTGIGIWPAGGYNQPYQAFESSESKSRFAGLVEVSGVGRHLSRVDARSATTEELLRVHTREYLEILAKGNTSGGDGGDGATPFGRSSFDIAKLAVGGTIETADAIMRGEIRNGYALTRPPGHHAEPEMGRGYCLLSNVCVTIEHLRATYGVERVAIVDYDVHHGNGAQKIYWEDPGVLAISLHQDRLFPIDSGAIDEEGGGDGLGFNINIPLPAGSGNGAYFYAIDEVVLPALKAFKPEIILVSSGFDPSPLDPLGCMSVTSGGFRRIARSVIDAAERLCNGRILFSHEGGYSAVHVPFCGLAVLEELSGIMTDVVDPFGPSFDDSPAHELLPHQKAVVDEVARRRNLAG